jgi:hypothetical protein
MAGCASSRPLLDGFFSRSAASFASRSLRKRSVFWSRSSRSSSCSSFNECFVGALGFFPIVASCFNGFVARVLLAPWAFPPSLPPRALSAEGLPFDCSLVATPFFSGSRNHGRQKAAAVSNAVRTVAWKIIKAAWSGCRTFELFLSSIYCLQPFRLKARSGWPLLSKDIMTRSGPLRQPAQGLLRYNPSHP